MCLWSVSTSDLSNYLVWKSQASQTFVKLNKVMHGGLDVYKNLDMTESKPVNQVWAGLTGTIEKI